MSRNIVVSITRELEFNFIRIDRSKRRQVNTQNTSVQEQRELDYRRGSREVSTKTRAVENAKGERKLASNLLVIL